MGSDARLAARDAFAPSATEAPTDALRALPADASPYAKDYFIERDGALYAGTHLILDLWEAEGLDDVERMDRALRDAAEACGATLLHVHVHPFEPNGGVSGIAVLAESHISVHTWPESGYAAIDAFMCGRCEPERCVPVFEAAFSPGRVETQTHLRGKVG